MSQELVEQAAASARDTALALDRIVGGEGTPEDYEAFTGERSESDCFDILNCAVLEQYTVFHDTTPQEVVMVIGTGGPHQELQIKENGDTKVVAYWSGEARRYAHLPNLAAFVWELVTE